VRAWRHRVVEKAGEDHQQVVSGVVEARTPPPPPPPPPPPRQRRRSMATKCPVCGGRSRRKETAPQLTLIVRDRHLHRAITKRLIGFARANSMDIEGLGEEAPKQIVDSGLVKSVTDSTASTRKVLGPKVSRDTKAQNLLTASRRAKGRGLARLVAALSIYMVGGSMHEVLTGAFPRLDELRAAARSRSRR